MQAGCGLEGEETRQSRGGTDKIKGLVEIETALADAGGCAEREEKKRLLIFLERWV